MLRYALSLVILRVGTVRGCLGCVPGDRPAHIARDTASSSGRLYVEWDTHDCGSRTSYATGATVDFSVGTLTKTEHAWDVTDGLNFGAETKPPALDADQPEGGGYVSIDGVQYTMPGMISAWSAYRSYKWSWWYSEKLGRFYFIYLADADDHSGEKEEMRICVKATGACTSATNPLQGHGFPGFAVNVVYDEMDTPLAAVGVTDCNPIWYFELTETGAKSVGYLNDPAGTGASKERPPSFYDATDGNVYSIDKSNGGGAKLERWNVKTGATATTHIPAAEVLRLTATGLSVGALVGIIAGAALLVLALAAFFIRRARRIKAPNFKRYTDSRTSALQSWPPAHTPTTSAA